MVVTRAFIFVTDLHVGYVYARTVTIIYKKNDRIKRLISNVKRGKVFEVHG